MLAYAILDWTADSRRASGPRPSHLAESTGYISLSEAREMARGGSGLSDAELRRALVELADQFDANVEKLVQQRFATGAFVRLPPEHNRADRIAQLPLNTPFVFVRGDPDDPSCALDVVALTREEFPEVWASNAELVWIRQRLKRGTGGAGRD